MPLFRVLLQGSNFVMPLEKRACRLGFLSESVVEAASHQQAEQAAAQMLRTHPELKRLVQNERSNTPRMQLIHMEDAEDAREGLVSLTWFSEEESGWISQGEAPIGEAIDRTQVTGSLPVSFGCYGVFLHGKNYWIDLDGSLNRCGFYTTVFLEATDVSAAKFAAVQKIRALRKLNEAIQNSPDDHPKIYVNEVREMEEVEHESPIVLGLAWYRMSAPNV